MLNLCKSILTVEKQRLLQYYPVQRTPWTLSCGTMFPVKPKESCEVVCMGSGYNANSFHYWILIYLFIYLFSNIWYTAQFLCMILIEFITRQIKICKLFLF